MEFTITPEFLNRIQYNNGYKFEDYLNNFNNIMPQVIFNSDEPLVETAKKFFAIIGNHSHAISGDISPPYKLFDLLQKPDELLLLDGTLDSTLRHQGSIYIQTYYWIIFIIELLNRNEDAIHNNSKIPLEYQLYYEYYIIDALINYYSCGLQPWYYKNIIKSEIFNEYTNLDTQKNIITAKIIKLVEEHLIKLKNILIQKCKKNQITPIRVLWLYPSPLSFEEIKDVLDCTKNKYIRSSLIWVAGFQKINEVKDLCENDLEKQAFEIGYNINNKSFIKNNSKLEIKIIHNYYYNYGMNYSDNKFFGWDGTNKEIEDEINKYNNKDLIDYYEERKELFKFLNNNPNKVDLKELNKKFFPQGNRSTKSFLTFHPFYTFNNNVLNWNYIITKENINFKNISNEYINYYKNNNSNINYYLNEYENTCYFFHNDNLIVYE